MQNNRSWVASILGLLVACGGTEFTSGPGDGGTGAGGDMGTSSTSTSAVTTGTSDNTTSGNTTGTSSVTTGSGGLSTSSSTTTGGGMGGAGTAGASGAGGKSGSGGQGGATSGGGKGGASGSGGGHAGASGSGGAGMGGRGSGGTGGVDAGPDASVDCAALRTDVDAKLVAAQKCDPNAMVVQCQDVIAGLCCSAPIASKSSPEGMAYLAALDRYKAAQCRTICPLIACRIGMTSCVAALDGAGRCDFFVPPPP